MEIGSHLDLQQPSRVPVVHLAKNRIRQINPVNPPPALRRYLGGCVVEMLIFGFQKTEINLIQLVIEDLLWKFVAVRSRVRAEQNPVLVPFEELAGSCRLASEFADARGNIDEHVGKAVEIFGYVLQILCEVSYMECHKLGFRMPRHHSIAGSDQFVVAGKISSMERPVRMVVQFLVPLVKAVRRGKECNRIRDMNGHGEVELAAGIPHGIEPGIVDLHERARGDAFAKVKAESLKNLQTSRAVAMRLLDRPRLHLWIVRLLKSRVRRFGKSIETSLMRTIIVRDGFREAFVVPASQVHHRANILALHYRQQLLRRAQVFPLRSKLDAMF